MKLDDFERGKSGRWARYRVELSDIKGEGRYELTVAGPTALVNEAFAESDFEVMIEPGGREAKLKSRLEEFLAGSQGEERSDLDYERPDSLLKPMPAAPTKDSAVVALRPLGPSQTLWGLSLPLFVPRGASLFFLLPWVCVCGGLVMPASGDPDLFLSLNSAAAAPVSISALGGTSWDRVSFAGSCWPWTHFIPFFRVFGFRASACHFACGGYGLP